MYSPHLMNGNFLIMLSILPYHAMRFPCIIHYFYNILLSSEIYNCANTVGVGIIGIQVQPLSTDRFLLSLSSCFYFYIMLLIYIILYISVTLKYFSENNKTEQFRSVLLIFFRKNNSFIQLNCNEVINRVNNYENYDWYPNTEVRID